MRDVIGSGSLARAASRRTFAVEVADALCRTPRQLPSYYLYDELGSALFEAICRLPWYPITRAESHLLARHAPVITRPLRRPLQVAELGCGNGEKLATLLEHVGEPIGLVQLIDVSSAALAQAGQNLTHLPIDAVVALEGPYEEGLLSIDDNRLADGAMLVLFLGSNLGNFDPPAAGELLARIRASLRPGDALLLGTDLVKPTRDLILAYDDPLQVTAAFNRNLLRRINDELGGTFELDGFAHRVVWNGEWHRIEMHLVSLRPQRVRIADADLDITFEQDEWIWTESSYKYQPAGVIAEGLAAGFATAEQWIDEEARFALTRFMVET